LNEKNLKRKPKPPPGISPPSKVPNFFKNGWGLAAVKKVKFATVMGIYLIEKITRSEGIGLGEDHHRPLFS
jgi:hypothetical protein